MLVFGPDSENTLAAKIQQVETGEAIMPCFTSWCSKCSTKYWITHDLAQFSTTSAHHVHKYILWRKLVDAKLI